MEEILKIWGLPPSRGQDWKHEERDLQLNKMGGALKLLGEDNKTIMEDFTCTQ